MLLAALILPTLLALVAGRPVPSKPGVDVTKVGKLKVAVDGPVLRFTSSNCSGTYFIKYATTATDTIFPGFCVNEGLSEQTSTTCPLKLDAEGLLELDMVRIPPGCSLKMINAYFPEKDEHESSGVPAVAIIVPCAIIGIPLVAVLVTIVVCCYKRRKIAGRVSASAVQPSPSDSLPTAFPSSAALEPKISTDKLEASISSVPALKPPKKTTMKKVSSPANNAIDKSKQKIAPIGF